MEQIFKHGRYNVYEDTERLVWGAVGTLLLRAGFVFPGDSVLVWPFGKGVIFLCARFCLSHLPSSVSLVQYFY